MVSQSAFVELTLVEVFERREKKKKLIKNTLYIHQRT